MWGREIRHPAQEAERRASYGEGSVSLAIDLPSNLSAVLPQTIEDALTVVTRLGETYLWVDAYCIDQKKEADKQAQKKQMDKIYSNTFLTVAAASKTDVNAGLPGVSQPFDTYISTSGTYVFRELYPLIRIPVRVTGLCFGSKRWGYLLYIPRTCFTAQPRTKKERC